MSNLLAIDFDFFFENPLDGGESRGGESFLYDWGHQENSFMIEHMWGPRSYGFLRNDLPLPMVNDDWKTFLSRFQFSPDARSYISESNLEAGLIDPQHGGAFEQVWLYDAHHDSGYRQQTLKQWTKRGIISCEDWMMLRYAQGSELHVRYPQWKVGWDHEPEPSVPVDRKPDDLTSPDVVFDTVHLCRSGAWVPAWCDVEFFALTTMLPGEVTEVGDYPLLPRQFSVEEQRQRMTEEMEAMAEFEKVRAEMVRDET